MLVAPAPSARAAQIVLDNSVLAPPTLPGLGEELSAAYRRIQTGNASRDDYLAFLEAGQQGEPNSQFALGVLLEQSPGVGAKERFAAIDWYRKAARQDHGPAQFNLAAMLLREENGQEEGLQWLQKAADGGSTRAMFSLAALYERGTGVEQDLEKALALYQRAGAAGDPRGFLLAGGLLEARKDFDSQTKAIELFGKAAPELPAASMHLARKYLSGAGIKRSPAAAKQWFEYTVKSHASPQAMVELALLYERGDLGKPEYAAALDWLQRAEKLKDVTAFVHLGRLHELGRGVPKSTESALAYYQKAAAAGFAPGQYHVGRFHEKGIAMSADPTAAARFYYEAANAGMPEAQFSLGVLYAEGKGLMQDHAAAATWLDRAHRADHLEAKVRLGRLFELGAGVEPSAELAARLYSFSAERGNPQAQAYLAQLYAEGRGVRRDLLKAYALAFAASESHPDLVGELLQKLEGQLSAKQKAEAKATLSKPGG